MIKYELIFQRGHYEIWNKKLNEFYESYDESEYKYALKDLDKLNR